MDAGREKNHLRAWGQGELRRYNLSPPLLCDNNNRDVHCTQLFIISDTSLTISLIDNVHSDIARWAATQIYLFHSQNLKVLFSFMNPRTNWYFVSALGLGPIMESQRREMDKLFLFHCRLRGFYGIVHVDKEETEIVLTEARSGEEQMRWKISSVNRVFCPKTVCKRDKNKILVIITNRSVITNISFSEERCWLVWLFLLKSNCKFIKLKSKERADSDFTIPRSHHLLLIPLPMHSLVLSGLVLV